MANPPVAVPLPSLFGGEVAVASVPDGPDYRDGPCFATELAAYRRTVASIRRNPWTHLPAGLASTYHHGLRRDYLKPPARPTLATLAKGLAWVNRPVPGDHREAPDYPNALAWLLARRAALGLASPGEILHFQSERTATP